MTAQLILTVIGPDKPGLVEHLAETVARHEGNWEASRLSHLAGRFAGVIVVSVPETLRDTLVADLQKLEPEGLAVRVESGLDAASKEGYRTLHLDLWGTDRPGIVRHVSQLFRNHGINVEELRTERTSAPMSVETLFKVTAHLSCPASTSVESLRTDLERIAGDLMVDIELGGD